MFSFDDFVAQQGAQNFKIVALNFKLSAQNSLKIVKNMFGVEYLKYGMVVKGLMQYILNLIVHFLRRIGYIVWKLNMSGFLTY